MTNEERLKKVSETKQKQFQESIAHVNIEDLKQKYLVEDWTYEQIRTYYNLTGYTLDKILRVNSLKKPRTQSGKRGLQTKYVNAGSKEQYFENLNKTLKENLLKRGITWEQHCKTVSDSCKQTWATKSPESKAIRAQGIRDNYFNVPEKIEAAKVKRSQTNMERYGVDNTYGLACKYVSNSQPNKDFANKLQENNISFRQEVFVPRDTHGHGYRYDFLIDKTFLEIDPWPFHNINWAPIDHSKGISKDYHYNKTAAALNAGYRCLHIWDWDNVDKIIDSLQPKTKIYARNTEIKIVSEIDVNNFLNKYHFQGTCKGQTYCYGLYYNDDLVQLMTFGKARYNKNYQFELLRLCTRNDLFVVGGAEKLFKHFINEQNPQSIISYCDNSKFTGDVYFRLGMTKLNNGSPTRHWYNPFTNQHITDNLLRQRGFDQLFGTNYGKGTSNVELMLANDFIEIYDCGQSVFIWQI